MKLIGFIKVGLYMKLTRIIKVYRYHEVVNAHQSHDKS